MSHDRVHTLDDLEAWSFDGVALAVLGHPVAHSISPPMHNAALAALASARPDFARWRYFKFDVEPGILALALPLFHARGFRGLNLTIPHKVIAVPLTARVEPAAAEAGAVNTLCWRDDGWEGFNTDGYGVSRAVAGDLQRSLQGASVILLGAGGAARAAAVTCLREGCAGLWIGNRTQKNLEALLDVLDPIAAARGVRLAGFDLKAPPPEIPADAIVINATSAGLKPGDAPPIDPARLKGRPCFYDMIYNPPETPLLKAAAAAGFPAANGLSMLVHQGAHALELWTGECVSVPIMHQACLQALGRAAPTP